MANDAVAGNALRVAPAQPGATDDPVRGVLAAFTKDLIEGVDETLAAFLAAEVESLTEIDAAMGGFAATASDCVLAGGKRVRPTFAYWGWRGVVGGEEPLCSVLPALSALELLHTFALVHDDVMDASDTRRGLPTAHRAAAARHRAAGHTGDPDRYGEAVAVLIGDLCMVWADRLMAHAAVPADRLLDVRRCYDQMRVETVAGQFLDVLGENDSASWTVDRALRVARYKTASYTVQRPLLFGACLAGADADDPLIAAYTRYGLAVGEAFQLRDDLLGVYGDPATTGKPAGDDLRTGKPTALLMLARQLADPAQRRALDRAGSVTSAHEVARLADVVRDTGATAQVERMISERVTEALAALRTAPIDETARTALTGLATAATARRA
ncbi:MULTISPECIES: polyprenyl synthetase family protein [unclassified Micromonospora]|uniref:polyprenyl synthetase family protein n=1 Tax=unclassified Micromonospora TaxID=2617518 RepID=UPI001C2486A8|nr:MULTISPECIES: polyprenyl synthetase family protein [unclassified Micromonospora]MBU8858235.1 polyprenyl synthetase family protein [Micromonospora sp. WMMB482]MDM4783878.1 polyprenyl synthetase family protein [Micromonospora sp. b486]MDM4784688.1 polyprenyl synthetase family protein [Micromonospora sp. b486]